MKTVIDYIPSRVIYLDASEYLFFSGTSYLGMGHQAAFRAALTEGVNRYGTIFSASRNNNVQLKIYAEAEAYLADWTGADDALTLTSGLMAGQLAVQYLKHKNFIYAPGAHPAVWHEQPDVRYKNYADFSKRISEDVQNTNGDGVVIASNTIDPLYCNAYSFDWIAELPQNQDITLLFDDSHGIGIVGENGAGFYRHLKNKIRSDNVKLIVIASMAKALGIPAGMILGDKNSLSDIRKNPLFVGASPVVPAYLYAFLASQNLYDSARLQLLQNITLFKNSYKTEGGSIFKSIPEYPVFFSLKDNLFDFLFKHKIFISNFPYPKADDKPITRIILSALHQENDIKILCQALQQFK